MAVIHETPGMIDIRSFTVLGLHSKPNSDSPIGKFGTGLKVAVATLLRLGCKIQVFVGGVEYEFYTSRGEFRDVEFQQIRMKKRKGMLSKWSYVELPFTTDYGKFWEVWQAFRELHSNTLDEGGTTFLNMSPLNFVCDNTVIVVSGDLYELAYMDRDTIFLPQALTKREGDDRVQVFNEPSKHIYWRGIRVFDLEKPSIYTYNILDDVTLTEDRTLKYVWDAQSKIAAFVARSKDSKLISAVVGADPDKFFEGRVDFDYAYVSPSEEFKEVVAKKKGRGGYVSPRALTYYDKYAPKPVTQEVSLRSQIEKWAYGTGLPEELQELLKYLLRCKIEEPPPVDPDDDGILF